MDQSEVLSYIHQAGDCHMSEIIQAVIRRYGILHSDSEIIFLSLPRNNPQERQNTLDAFFRFLNSHG